MSKKRTPVPQKPPKIETSKKVYNRKSVGQTMKVIDALYKPPFDDTDKKLYKCLHGVSPLSPVVDESRWGMLKGIQIKIIKCSTCKRLDVAQYIKHGKHYTVKELLTKEEWKHYDPR